MAKAVFDALVARFPDAVYEPYEGVGGDDCAFVVKQRIADVCRMLRDDPRLAFNMAPYITAVDYLGQEPRFEVVYNLLSTVHNHRIRLRVKVPEPCWTISSV